MEARLITLGDNDICVPCSVNAGVYWANGLVSKEEMLLGALYWEDNEYDPDDVHCASFWVCYEDDGDEFFYQCHEKDEGAFFVTHLRLRYL